jgi:hypothetical protein
LGCDPLQPTDALAVVEDLTTLRPEVAAKIDLP